MSTPTPSPAAAPALSLDVSDTPAVPFTRLVSVELRKMADTRAGRWLLAAIVAVTALVVVLIALLGHDRDHTFFSYLGATAGPQGFLLPVLGILLITSEWGQRTTLTTFTLEPSRGRVIGAKVVAALLFGLAAIIVAIVIATIATLATHADHAFDDLGVGDFGKFGILQVSGILMGLGFGLIFLNSAAAIVVYYVLPIAFSILVNIWPAMRDAAPWIDTSTAQTPLFDGGSLSGSEWAHLASASAIWILLPLVIGLIRVQRAEVK